MKGVSMTHNTTQQLAKWGDAGYVKVEKTDSDAWMVSLSFKQSGNTLDEAVIIMADIVSGSMLTDTQFYPDMVSQKDCLMCGFSMMRLNGWYVFRGIEPLCQVCFDKVMKNKK